MTASRTSRILLRSSWQTVNIGDIAHTPGMLRLLEAYLPEAEVRLWPTLLDQGVEALLHTRFPHVPLVRSPAELAQAFRECDLLLHGSGPSLVAQSDVARWRKETGKPYGVFGITVSRQPSTATAPVTDDALAGTMAVLSGAAFVFFRDSPSLALAKQMGCACPVMAFGPDAAFATDLRDDAAAEAFLVRHGLQEGRFLCCIGRLRYTPYWRMPEHADRPRDEVKHARNEAMKERDHAPLREAVIRIVRETGLKVLLCPEDKSQMSVNREMLYERLPPDVQSNVVWREQYWLTGEAVSTYVRSAGLFGHEMHSPILCIGHGVPAIVCRWHEQTTKGFMWDDIGLSDWLFDFDKAEDRARLPSAVLALARDPDRCRGIAAEARARVRHRHKQALACLTETLRS